MVRYLLVLTVAAALAAAAGCGDDDEDSLSTTPDPAIEQYFGEYQAINDDYGTLIAAVDATYPDAWKGDVQQTKDAFAAYVTLFDETVEKYARLDVPAELDDLHRDLADADGSEINHRRLALLENATTAADVDAIFAEDPAYTDAVERGDAGCLALEQKAANYGIEFDLPCEK